MTRIPMIAITDFEWDGASRAKGDRFEVKPIEAAALKYQERARLITPEDDPVPMEPEPAPVVEPVIAKEMRARAKRKPRKQRRDIPNTQHTKA